MDEKIEKLRLSKDSGYKYRERRQNDWRENYTLYRDKVTINRLTQRQSVNIPLMKQVIRTLLKDVDDMPVIYFENLDNDKEKEVFQNEYWNWTVDKNNLSVKDIVDKRQVFMFGRSFDQMQIADGMVKFTIQDPQDILVDRYLDPTDLDTSRFLIHPHIFVPLKVIENNENYNKEAIKKLKDFHKSTSGLLKSKQNEDMLTEKNQRMIDMGLEDVIDPVLGETYVELTLNFVYDDERGDEELFLRVTADDMSLLRDDPLDEVIGKTKDDYWKTHFPYNTWADDVDRQDFWSDGIADIIRTPNKVLNAWFSQLVENRTLRNFGMNYYDGSIAGEFAPQTFNPQPWGWYKIPGDPNKMIKRVDIPDLSESLDEMQFVINLAEKATGATPTQQGNIAERQITLGEVELALGEAKERVKGMSKFYTPAWQQRGKKFLKLIEAGSDKLDAVKIYKKGRNTDKVFEREIGPNDWMSKSGYQEKVWSQDEKQAQDTEELQKFNAVVTNIPGNTKLLEIYKRKLLEFAKLSPEEINEVMEEEERKAEMFANAGLQQPQPGMGQPNQQPQPNLEPIQPQQ